MLSYFWGQKCLKKSQEKCTVSRFSGMNKVNPSVGIHNNGKLGEQRGKIPSVIREYFVWGWYEDVPLHKYT